MPLPKSSLSQHFKVLRESGLIRSERNGVELKNYTRCDELQKKYAKLIQTILQRTAGKSNDSNELGDAICLIPSQPMCSPSFLSRR
jgi:DNA-binding transcriptional ArsR family regulator